MDNTLQVVEILLEPVNISLRYIERPKSQICRCSVVETEDAVLAELGYQRWFTIRRPSSGKMVRRSSFWRRSERSGDAQKWVRGQVGTPSL